MSNYKVDICGVNTSKLPLLSEEEKEDLMIRIKNKDADAREKFISGNLRLVLSVIQRFSNNNENMNDLFQVGCIGLIKAIDNFDLNYDVKFSTYAVPLIQGELRRYIRDNNPIRISRSIRDIAYKAITIREMLLNEKNREPSIEEIAATTHLPTIEIQYALDAIQSPVSLYDPVYTEGGDALCIMDQLYDKKQTEEQWINNLALKEAVKKLNKRENRIIEMRFYEGKTQMEIADELSISQAQISRIEKSAIHNMRDYLNE